MTEQYVLSARLAHDKYKRHWFADVSAKDGALYFTLTEEPKRALRLPESMARAIAELTTNETILVEPLKSAALELATVLAQQIR